MDEMIMKYLKTYREGIIENITENIIRENELELVSGYEDMFIDIYLAVEALLFKDIEE